MKRHFVEIFIHIIFWGSTAFLLTTNFSIESHTIELINGVETVSIVRNSGLIFQIINIVLISIFLAYINIWLIVHLKQSNKTKTVIYVLMAFLGALLLSYFIIHLPIYGKVPQLPIPLVFGLVSFYGALSVAYGLGKLWYLNAQRHQQLLIDKNKTELSLLRNQLQPHFLFNALNNLLSMVHSTDNPKLIDAIERLSNLLRYVVEETKGNKVPLHKEIFFLQNYIELQLLRFNESEVKIDFIIDGKYDQQNVEPGLLIPFVENAFKYGAEPEKTNQIDLRFDITQPDQIQFYLKNKIMLQSSDGNGTGIISTKKRLDLIYPNKYSLTINENEYFIVELKLTTR
ncbi:MAG: histidine kinase [Saprospiraceae bacterium]